MTLLLTRVDDMQKLLLVFAAVLSLVALGELVPLTFLGGGNNMRADSLLFVWISFNSGWGLSGWRFST